MRFASSLGLLTAVLTLATPANSAFEGAQFAAALVVPSAPALTHTVVGSTVTMTWSPAPGGGAPTSYSLEASLTPGGPAIVVFPTTATSLTVPNVPGGTYFVRVIGVNAEGAGPPSNERTVVVGGACQQPPGAPGTLVASPPGPTDLLYSATLPGGDDVVHYTVGGGIVLSNNIEVNGGADWSKRTTAITASAVVRF